MPPERIAGDNRGQALGLFGLRERLQALGGEMQIDSIPGDGTCITLLAPLSRETGYPQAREAVSPESIPAPPHRRLQADPTIEAGEARQQAGAPDESESRHRARR